MSEPLTLTKDEMALRAVAILIEAMAADMRLGLVAPVVEAEPQRKDR